MSMRGLLMGALMLGFGAVFTWGLAASFEHRAMQSNMMAATADPSAAFSAIAKRSDRDWMF